MANPAFHRGMRTLGIGFGQKERALGHAAACRAVLGTADGVDHAAAVGRHRRFVCEVLAELSGHRHPLAPLDPPGDGLRPRDAGPVLYVSVHRGNWIVGARALGNPDRPIHTVAGTQLHRAVSPWLVRWLQRRGVVVHPGAGAHRALARTLRAGGRVLLHLDGDPFGGGSRTRGVGHDVLPRRNLPAGVRSAALLAARHGVRVEGVLCERDLGGTFQVRKTELTVPADVSSTRVHVASTHWEARLMRYLVDTVREDPERWLLFRDEHLAGGA